MRRPADVLLVLPGCKTHDEELPVIGGVGWIGLVLDESMGEWDAMIVEREGA